MNSATTSYRAAPGVIDGERRSHSSRTLMVRDRAATRDLGVAPLGSSTSEPRRVMAEGPSAAALATVDTRNQRRPA